MGIKEAYRLYSVKSVLYEEMENKETKEAVFLKIEIMNLFYFLDHKFKKVVS
jgi:hypothetical protein